MVEINTPGLSEGEADSLYYPLSTNPAGYLIKSVADGYYLGISTQATDSALLQGHNAAYFQIAGSYLTQLTTSTPTNLTGFIKGNGSVLSADNSTYYKSGDNAIFGTLKLAYNTSIYSTQIVSSDGTLTITNVGGTIGDVVIHPTGTATSVSLLSDNGKMTLGGNLGTNNESLLLDFETIANKIDISSITGVTDIIFTNITPNAPYFGITTSPTVNSTGIDTILDRTAVGATNAGWLPFKKSDGTIVYIPYWN